MSQKPPEPYRTPNTPEARVAAHFAMVEAVVADAREAAIVAVGAADEQVAALIRQVGEQAAAIHALEVERDALRKRVGDLMDEVDEAEREREAMRKELNAARATIEVLRAPMRGEALLDAELRQAKAPAFQRYIGGEDPRPGDRVRIPNGTADRLVLAIGSDGGVVLKGESRPRPATSLRLVRRQPE